MNNTYSLRKPHSFDWAKALLVSIMVHLVIIAAWIGAILLEVFVIKAQEVVQEIKEDQYLTVPTEFVEAFQETQVAPEPEAPVAEPEPAPAEKQFLPTQESQETTEPVQSARYFGERNTAAASSGEAVENGLEVPSQEGREQLSPNDFELSDSDFSDSDLDGSPGVPGEPLPPSPVVTDAAETQPNEETFSETQEEPIEQPQETPLLETTQPSETPVEEATVDNEPQQEELLSLEESLPVAKEEEEEEKPLEEPKEEKELVEEQIPEPKVATPSGAVPGERGLQSGYDREARKTRISGTIRRRGKNSLDVEDTVKGRFLATMNKEIERAWQRECILRREFILPGVLSVSFSINEQGRVTGFRFDSRIAGGAIQEGFTMRAIQKAKIPAMPEELTEELQGAELELNLTFMF